MQNIILKNDLERGLSEKIGLLSNSELCGLKILYQINHTIFTGKNAQKITINTYMNITISIFYFYFSVFLVPDQT